MPKLTQLIGTTTQDSASSAEVMTLKAKVAALEAQIKAIPETIVVSSINDLPDPTQHKSGAAARVLSNGQEYIATGVKDSTATSWEA